MCSKCIVRGPAEGDTTWVDICKATYTGGTGTKVYYDGDMPYDSLGGIYSSYAPTVSVDGVTGGNGLHAEGRHSSAWGYASHAEGDTCHAWGDYTHAEGGGTEAIGKYSHAEGKSSKANGDYSHCEGLQSIAGGLQAHAEGYDCVASGDRSHAEGYSTIASGESSHAGGRETEAAGYFSKSSGRESKALRTNEQAYSSGKRVAIADDQIIRITYSRTVADAGWWEIKLLAEIEDGKAYHFDTMVIGRQISGAGGAVGNTFSYKFNGTIMRDGATCSTVGTPIRTLTGRSAGMSGDGLTTGERMSYIDPNSGTSTLNLAYVGIINTTFRIQTHSWIQEIKI